MKVVSAQGLQRLFLAYLAASISATICLLLIMTIMGTSIRAAVDLPTLWVWVGLVLVYTLPCGLIGLLLLRLTRQSSYPAYGLVGFGLAVAALFAVNPLDLHSWNILLIPIAVPGAVAALVFRRFVGPTLLDSRREGLRPN